MPAETAGGAAELADAVAHFFKVRGVPFNAGNAHSGKVSTHVVAQSICLFSRMSD
jgi:hypothetical protein